MKLTGSYVDGIHLLITRITQVMMVMKRVSRQGALFIYKATEYTELQEFFLFFLGALCGYLQAFTANRL